MGTSQGQQGQKSQDIPPGMALALLGVIVGVEATPLKRAISPGTPPTYTSRSHRFESAQSFRYT